MSFWDWTALYAAANRYSREILPDVANSRLVTPDLFTLTNLYGDPFRSSHGVLGPLRQTRHHTHRHVHALQLIVRDEQELAFVVTRIFLIRHNLD